MKLFILFSTVCVQFLTSHGAPDSVGVGSFIYADSNGNRYGGAYDSKDGVVTSYKDFSNDKSKPGGVAPNRDGSQLNGFNSRPDVFNNGQGHGNAASNMGFPFNFVNSFVPTFNPGLNPGLNTFSDRATQGAAVATAGAYNPLPAFNNIFSNFFPTYFNNLQRNLQQAFQFNIENQRLAFDAARRAYDEDNPNVSVVAPAQAGSSGPGYSMVSANSFMTSSNINGQEVTHKGATTIVDDNGKVTRYEVRN